MFHARQHEISQLSGVAPDIERLEPIDGEAFAADLGLGGKPEPDDIPGVEMPWVLEYAGTFVPVLADAESLQKAHV